MTRALLAIAAAAATLLCPAAGAPMGQSEAIMRLLNSQASQSPRLYAEAAAQVRSAADEGMPLQKYLLAVLHGSPGLPDAARIDDETRRRFLESSRGVIRQFAERKNNALAWYLLSLETNDLDLLARAAEGGNVQALNARGTMLLERALAEPGAATNTLYGAFRESFNCFKAAALKKDPNGLYNTGMCYMQGFGCEVDGQLAFECFRTAAESGHPQAINNIGGCYRDGLLVAPDPAVAAKWFSKSAELGDAYGMLNYALALQRGDGVSRDEAKAAGLLRTSAMQGCAEAMDAYGMCYHAGRGVAKDPDLAAAWFRKSAEAGFPPAMENMSACYENGEGVERSAMQATIWKMRARAARGDAAAAEWLGANALPKDD